MGLQAFNSTTSYIVPLEKIYNLIRVKHSKLMKYKGLIYLSSIDYLYSSQSNSIVSNGYIVVAYQ